MEHGDGGPGAAGAQAEDRYLELVADLYAAFGRGDLAWLQAHVSPDTVLHVAGTSPLAGTYSGLGSVMAFAANSTRTFDPSTVRVIEIRVLSDGIVRSVTTSDVHSLGGERRTFRVVQDIRFDERDRMVEAWLSVEDQAEFDDFLA
jgi:ketosteroid isomerase-like protein